MLEAQTSYSPTIAEPSSMDTSVFVNEEIEIGIKHAVNELNIDLDLAQNEASRLNKLKKTEIYRYAVQVTPTEEKREYGINKDKYEVIVVKNA